MSDVKKQFIFPITIRLEAGKIIESALSGIPVDKVVPMDDLGLTPLRAAVIISVPNMADANQFTRDLARELSTAKLIQSASTGTVQELLAPVEAKE